MTFVFTDPHGSIGRMSAPQRSFGRKISRREPASGVAADAGHPAAAGHRLPPEPGPVVTAAPERSAAGPDSPAAGLVLASIGGDRRIAPPAGPMVSATAILRPAHRLGTGTPPDGATTSAASPADVIVDGRTGSAGLPHPVELAGLLHELTARLLGADDVPQALDRLAAFAAGAVPGALRCSVALIGEGGPPELAASGSAAQALDDLQYAGGDGPGLEAARTRALVTAPDLQSDPRWPKLAELARAQGVHGVVAIPMDVQRSSVGALSLFVATPGGIDPELLLTAMAVVNQAEVLLGELRRREGLREGATVDRAAGVIIAQRGCGVQEAYNVLRETAQRLGLDRRTVAERLIAAAARNAEA
jgi:hypothetical protein